MVSLIKYGQKWLSAYNFGISDVQKIKNFYLANLLSSLIFFTQIRGFL